MAYTLDMYVEHILGYAQDENPRISADRVRKFIKESEELLGEDWIDFTEKEEDDIIQRAIEDQNERDLDLFDGSENFL